MSQMLRMPRKTKNAGGLTAARSIDQREASRGIRLVPPATMPAMIRDPVAVLAIMPAAVVEVAADSPHVAHHRGAVDRGPIDSVDDRLFNGTARQRRGRDGSGRGDKRQDDFSHGILSIGGVQAPCAWV